MVFAVVLICLTLEAMSAQFVNTAPPPPHVITLFPLKDIEAKRLFDVTGRPSYSAPIEQRRLQ